jgi:hypothetical protein
MCGIGKLFFQPVKPVNIETGCCSARRHVDRLSSQNDQRMMVDSCREGLERRDGGSWGRGCMGLLYITFIHRQCRLRSGVAAEMPSSTCPSQA